MAGEVCLCLTLGVGGRMETGWVHEADHAAHRARCSPAYPPTVQDSSQNAHTVTPDHDNAPLGVGYRLAGAGYASGSLGNRRTIQLSDSLGCSW